MMLLTCPSLALGVNRGTDIFDQTGPVSNGLPAGGLYDKYPIGRYGLDTHVDTGVTHFGGNWSSAIHSVAGWIWDFNRWGYDHAIQLFAWAFSIDFLGDNSPLFQAMDAVARNLFQTTLGWAALSSVLTFVCFWGLYRVVVHGETTRVFKAILAATILPVIAFLVLMYPAKTIQPASRGASQLSAAFLAGGNIQDPATDQGIAKRNIADSLVDTFILKPWVIMDFGGLRHCVDKNNDPVSPSSQEKKTCIDHIKQNADGVGGYAARYLRWPVSSVERSVEYQAIKEGKTPDNAALIQQMIALAKGEDNPLRQTIPGVPPASVPGVPSSTVPTTSATGQAPGAATSGAITPQPQGSSADPSPTTSNGSPGGAPTTVVTPTPSAAIPQDESIPTLAQFKNYKLSAADRPAVDIQQQGQQNDRVIMALLVLFGGLGNMILLAVVALVLFLAAIRIIFYFMLTPLAFVLGGIPGGGHRFFKAWGVGIVEALAVKVVWSLVLGLFIAFTTGIQTHGAETLGWRWSFLISGAFAWILLFNRKKITNFMSNSVGHGAAHGSVRATMSQGVADAANFRRAASRAVSPLTDAKNLVQYGNKNGAKGVVERDARRKRAAKAHAVRAKESAERKEKRDTRPQRRSERHDEIIGYVSGRPAPTRPSREERVERGSARRSSRGTSTSDVTPTRKAPSAKPASSGGGAARPSRPSSTGPSKTGTVTGSPSGGAVKPAAKSVTKEPSTEFSEIDQWAARAARARESRGQQTIPGVPGVSVEEFKQHMTQMGWTRKRDGIDPTSSTWERDGKRVPSPILGEAIPDALRDVAKATGRTVEQVQRDIQRGARRG